MVTLHLIIYKFRNNEQKRKELNQLLEQQSKLKEKFNSHSFKEKNEIIHLENLIKITPIKLTKGAHIKLTK